MYSARFPAVLRLAIEGAIERVIRDHHLGRLPSIAYGEGEGELEVVILGGSSIPVDVDFDALRAPVRYLRLTTSPQGVSGVAEEDEQGYTTQTEVEP